ncbi:helix-turn-helix transcriptional regulator [Glycomyces sp. YM15]|uniref:helix-turn-helix transcriptional regulator n=1 Tax=Glycomyces sp. YM15 TaxID=2800446 RepID=UPI0035AC0CB0
MPACFHLQCPGPKLRTRARLSLCHASILASTPRTQLHSSGLVGSRSVQPGAKAASGTDSTGPDAAADRDSLRCPCHTQGATACTNLQTTASAEVESLWSIDQVAAYLKVPVQTLRAWRKHRTGPPAARIGRHLRYDPAQVRAWVADRVREASDD